MWAELKRADVFREQILLKTPVYNREQPGVRTTFCIARSRCIRAADVVQSDTTEFKKIKIVQHKFGLRPLSFVHNHFAPINVDPEQLLALFDEFFLFLLISFNAPIETRAVDLLCHEFADIRLEEFVVEGSELQNSEKFGNNTSSRAAFSSRLVQVETHPLCCSVWEQL
uniref:Uncharacterized protein n=1 Tax=Meloidogyne incognita TaxID=6306 RepID=A0A914N2F1_MELIC